MIPQKERSRIKREMKAKILRLVRAGIRTRLIYEKIGKGKYCYGYVSALVSQLRREHGFPAFKGGRLSGEHYNLPNVQCHAAQMYLLKNGGNGRF